MNLDFENTDKD